MMIVHVKQGALEGSQETSLLTGSTFYTFLGIPYGEPPIGDLRFRPPLPAGPWEGVRQSKKEASKCVQFESLFGGPPTGSEDCLYLNVFTPELPDGNSSLKPVMVYIHGGAFCHGVGPLECDFLVEHDVVVVTMNYRLGIFGFLNLNIPECPGNVGLKDQSLALKWIKDNISSFGGDPDNVTLFGESAGGSSVHLQALSPLSKGLCQRIIAQSGNALAQWTLTENPEENAFNAGKKLGFTGTDPDELVEFLRKQSTKDLLMAAGAVTDDFKNGAPARCQGLAFTPSVEKITENAFLPDTPANLLKTVKPLPAIAGVAETEGILIFAGLKNLSDLDGIPNDPTDAIKYNVPCDPSRVAEIAAKAQEFYFGNGGNDIKKQVVDMFTDIFFVRLYEAFDSAVKSNVPVYMYEFKFSGELNKSQQWIGPGRGACHADELGYLFPYRAIFPNAEYKDLERSLIENVCKLWTNFAKTGNPNTPAPISLTSEWKPVTPDRECYLQIDEVFKVLNGKIFGERLEFWAKLLSK